MWLRNDNVNDIVNLFPEKPIDVYESSGLNHGLILRYHKGYFKIYPSLPTGSYRIQRYYYHYNTSISDDVVNYNDIQDYLKNLH